MYCQWLWEFPFLIFGDVYISVLTKQKHHNKETDIERMYQVKKHLTAWQTILSYRFSRSVNSEKEGRKFYLQNLKVQKLISQS